MSWLCPVSKFTGIWTCSAFGQALYRQQSVPIHRRYSDYVRTESGLQFQDLREGTGKAAKSGSQVTVDWDGYTIGVPS